MRLSEALRAAQGRVEPGAKRRTLHVVCGFTPLHLETFVKAYAKLRFAGNDVAVSTGLFGDLLGNVARAASVPAEGALVVIEWADVDERLGLRASAGWSGETLPDILQQSAERLRLLEANLAELSAAMPVALVAPTLALPPMTHLRPVQAGTFELELKSLMSDFLVRVSKLRGARVVSESALALASPAPGRRDVKLDLHAGFPYTVAHADHVARMAIECLFPPAPKKGLITDLDDTLWKGILGEAGVDGVSWCMESHSQAHGLYQQALASLAESGVLIAVVSKNDPELAGQALARADVLIEARHVFPVEASWGPKSEAVGRILRLWNIGADSVVFVDDSAMELGEVGEKFPGIECLRFPTDEPAAVLDLIVQLRERFGKSEIREEDRIRLESLRSRPELDSIESGGGSDFVARLDAHLTLDFSGGVEDERALELVNKTNQFNLNGRRYTRQEWQALVNRPDAFVVTAAYVDRFGPLGKIAVAAGTRGERCIRVETWVMSCRAFSRQIEYEMLQRLFERFAVGEIELAFESTDRNGPLREFLARFRLTPAAQGLTLTIDAFRESCPPLHHRIVETGEPVAAGSK